MAPRTWSAPRIWLTGFNSPNGPPQLPVVCNEARGPEVPRGSQAQEVGYLQRTPRVTCQRSHRVSRGIAGAGRRPRKRTRQGPLLPGAACCSRSPMKHVRPSLAIVWLPLQMPRSLSRLVSAVRRRSAKRDTTPWRVHLEGRSGVIGESTTTRSKSSLERTSALVGERSPPSK